jgi:hypothetical protein
VAHAPLADLQIRGVGLEFAIFGEDAFHGGDGGFDLGLHGGERRRLEDDFEGVGSLLGRGAEDAKVAFLHYAVAGVEAVDDGGFVAREEGAGGLQGRLQEVLAEEIAADEAVAAFGGVVGVQLLRSLLRPADKLLRGERAGLFIPVNAGKTAFWQVTASHARA